MVWQSLRRLVWWLVRTPWRALPEMLWRASLEMLRRAPLQMEEVGASANDQRRYLKLEVEMPDDRSFGRVCCL